MLWKSCCSQYAHGELLCRSIQWQLIAGSYQVLSNLKGLRPLLRPLVHQRHDLIVGHELVDTVAAQQHVAIFWLQDYLRTALLIHAVCGCLLMDSTFNYVDRKT